MRKTILTMALVASASPLLGQAAQQAKDNDPTHKVAGGIGVAGWMGRIDPNAERRGMSISDAKFASMGSGYHITSGPAAVYWNPKDAAKGNFSVSGSFTQTKAADAPGSLRPLHRRTESGGARRRATSTSRRAATGSISSFTAPVTRPTSSSTGRIPT